MVCMNLTTGDMSTVGHRLIVQPGTATISATQTLSGNGKQINGWTLTGGAASGFTPSGNAVVRDTGCEGGALVWNTGTPSQPLTVTATGEASGLFVSGNGERPSPCRTPGHRLIHAHHPTARPLRGAGCLCPARAGSQRPDRA